ncbi:MAG: orotate phosphoribosyltransferase [Clostridia bacterium]|nr:orotate phosphoribosyltransferase [Clostridia bacterium]
MSDIMSYLFETKAVKFCEENKPFFLTSGTISPYFVNTHFLYGNEKEATEFLSYIDTLLADRINLPKKVFEKVLAQYEKNSIFKYTIDTMIKAITENVNVDEIDYISGGERRDWYFSNMIAYLLEKPHLTLFKDMEAFVSPYDFSSTEKITNIEGKTVLNASDLVTAASNYVRSWIPAVKNLNGKLLWTCYVVDRKQGGTEILEKEGIKTIPLALVDNTLFEKAFSLGIINKGQLDMLKGFYHDPYETMRNFLINHPEFIENALNSTDERTLKRVKTLTEGNLYNL